ncbi:MAG: lipase maturation factor family protein [Patescibacteria group bacterium]
MIHTPSTAPQKPLLIYDGQCGFCAIWIRLWKRITEDRVEYAPFQECADRFPQIPRSDFEKAVQLILPSGERLSGAAACTRSLGYARERRYALWEKMYARVPLFAPLSEHAYHFIARRRSLFYGATVFLFGASLAPSSYAFSTAIFWKILALIYAAAFASFGAQSLGLIGSRGVLPIADYIAAMRATFGLTGGITRAPTVFWLGTGDFFISIVSIAGIVAALLLFFGILPRPMLAFLFILYLSLVVGGQEFMSFQWDTLLLETGFLAIFLSANSRLSLLLFWWLLFRLVFFSGVVKLASGDTTWRNLTALSYHYETQPLPTIFGWYAHQMPLLFHKMSAAGMFFIELVLPFFFFAPRHLRFFAAAGAIALQLVIGLTGNYTFFNLLTIALALLLLDDQFWQGIIPTGFFEKIAGMGTSAAAGPFWTGAVIPAVAVLILVLSAGELLTIIRRRAPPEPFGSVLRFAAPLHLINSYGLFAVMTTTRPEIIMEGSDDGETWKEYAFKYKPGDQTRRPKWAQPHQPRLDWQMWFAALDRYQNNPWFVNFAARLLEGSPQVAALLKTNPFPTRPPKYIRALRYAYHFTTPSERSAGGAWWKRELKDIYLPPSSLGE